MHSFTGTEALYRPYGSQGSTGIALPFLDHGTRRGWEISVTPRPLFTHGKDPVPIVQEAGGGPMAGLERCGKSRPSPGFDPRTVQPLASCYIPLRYPAHTFRKEAQYFILHICNSVPNFSVTKPKAQFHKQVNALAKHRRSIVWSKCFVGVCVCVCVCGTGFTVLCLCM